MVSAHQLTMPPFTILAPSACPPPPAPFHLPAQPRFPENPKAIPGIPRPSPSPSPQHEAIAGARHPIWSRSALADLEMSLVETSMLHFKGLLPLPFAVLRLRDPQKALSPPSPLQLAGLGSGRWLQGGELQFIKLLAMPHFTAQFPLPPPAPPPGLKLAFLCTRTHVALKDCRLRD